MDGVLSPAGILYCQPWCSNRILRVNTNTGEVDLIGPDLGWGPDKYRAAIVATDGAVYCPPHSVPCLSWWQCAERQETCQNLEASHVLRIDLSTGAISFIGPDYGKRRGKWWTGAMSLVNTILCPPHSAGQVLQIDVFQQRCSLVGRDFGEDEAKYRAIVQSNDGCFYGPPCNAPQVICIDPIAPDADFIGHNHTLASRRSVFWTPSLAGPDFCAGGFKWVTASLGEDGCVYSPPWLAHKALRIDVPNRRALRCEREPLGTSCFAKNKRLGETNRQESWMGRREMGSHVRS
eukprot:g31243.t1